MTIGAKKLLLSGSSRLDVDKLFATRLYTDSVHGPVTVGTGFSPDLVWHKATATQDNNRLYDTARLPVNDLPRYLVTNGTSQEQTQHAGVYGMPTNGGFYGIGNSGNPMVGWSFRRSKRFFDIVTYTGNGVSGRQIAHSLGIRPGMVLIKRLDTVNHFIVKHTALADRYGLLLNDTRSVVDGADGWVVSYNETTVTLGTDTASNQSGGTYIAYLFAHDASQTGIIQCGTYTGNNGNVGPLINLGWEPQWLLTKRAVGGMSDWMILDSKRSTRTNPKDGRLYPNLNYAEEQNNGFGADFLANGFQPRSSIGQINGTGTYIYMAIRKGKA